MNHNSHNSLLRRITPPPKLFCAPCLCPQCSFSRQKTVKEWQTKVTLVSAATWDLDGSNSIYDHFVISATHSKEFAEAWFVTHGGDGLVAIGKATASRPEYVSPSVLPVLTGQQILGTCADLKANTYSTASIGGRAYSYIRWYFCNMPLSIHSLHPRRLSNAFFCVPRLPPSYNQ